MKADANFYSFADAEETMLLKIYGQAHLQHQHQLKAIKSTKFWTGFPVEGGTGGTQYYER